MAKSGIDYAQLVGTEDGEDGNSEAGDRQLSRKSSAVSISSRSTTKSSEDINEPVVEIDEGIKMEESSKGKVKGSIAGNYFKAGAHWSILFIIGSLYIIVQVLASGADYWVSVW